MNAVDRVMAVIEFNPDGTIVSANANFSSATGYCLDEIQSRHHRVFADPSYAASGEFERVARGSRQIWLQASCNPDHGCFRKGDARREIRGRYYRQKNRDGCDGPSRGHQPRLGRDQIQP
ncbi:MAG: hypothetical protein ABL956_06345 [Hyphomonadaceae bacterium]